MRTKDRSLSELKWAKRGDVVECSIHYPEQHSLTLQQTEASLSFDGKTTFVFKHYTRKSYSKCGVKAPRIS
jgi:hypothetical protein